MQWLEDDFLGYLHEWEESVAQRPEATSKEKKNMLLSQETRFGIEVTGKRENDYNNVLLLHMVVCAHA